ncbi:cytoplasmic protein [Kwoniella heveanensis BCC8398]|uniref:Cytoplasmic protein n=1 Tax=Kwoniella heveanensis BCC8398 TaxID=1296120 RepID=A0A1B9H184_9TREE|nr:cytoplasmic protein [Kwoniella heveanensis BCC8398]
MTHRSRSGGPQKKRGTGAKQTHTRKLHHPPPPPPEEPPSPPPESANPLPPSLESGPYNPPDSEILALLHRALHETLSSDEFVPTVQRIKGLLRDKKWLDVFCGTEGVLESYAGRWVPSRACCFRELMGHLVQGVFTGQEGDLEIAMGKLGLEDVDEVGEEDGDDEDDEEGDQAEDDVQSEDEQEAPKTVNELSQSSGHADTIDAESVPRPTHHILSLGGGAGSELLSTSALIRSVLISQPHSTQRPNFTWTGIDIGNWHKVLRKIEDAVRVDWKIDEDLLKVEYIKGDLVASTTEPLPDASRRPDIAHREAAKPIDLSEIMVAKAPKLITLLFTLTELLSQSRPRTLSLLSNITKHTPSGGLFLIVDSASDISEFSLGAEGRKWPIWMIVDAVLYQGGKGGWEKVREEDSRWFRFPEGVGAGWTVKLENTRYWYRLYRRV